MAGADTVVLVGPTAVGKTAVALALAEHWPIEVVSADSRQVYRGLDIATAAPARRERDRVRHHLTGILAPGERYSAGRFALEAAEALADIRLRERMPLVVGGSGLYIRALVDGLFAEPPLDRPRRTALAGFMATLDNATLVRWAARLDATMPPGGGRQRATRAIEIAILTGRSLGWWQRAAAVQGVITPWTVRLTVPRAVLHQRIQARAAEMVRRGLVEEVAAALADGAPLSGPGMDGIGVREAVDVLQGRLAREELVARIALATRQYAKRQETWFRNQSKGPVLVLDATTPPDRLAGMIVTAFEERTP